MALKDKPLNISTWEICVFVLLRLINFHIIFFNLMPFGFLGFSFQPMAIQLAPIAIIFFFHKIVCIKFQSFRPFKRTTTFHIFLFRCQDMKYQFYLFIFLCYFLKQSQCMKRMSFQDIRNEFKPKFDLWETIGQVQSNTVEPKQSQPISSRMSSLEMFKLKARQIFMRQVDICYRRFQRCSQQLSAAFCASTTKSVTFYVWARNVAEDIMNGHGDDDERFAYVKCSPGLLKKFFINKL